MFIDIKNARKHYGDGETLVNALDGVSLSLGEGKIYVILGPSGSGKSTLLNMIGGLDSLDSGEITISGRNISRSDKKKMTDYRREDVGFVFQFYNLIPDLTVQENIQVVADIAKQPMDIEEVMKALDIDKYKNRFPKELSGGQQQRVSIARALCMNPKILFFDEPTSALDPELTGEILKVIKDLAAEHITMVIVTHEMTFARDISDHIIFMDKGLIAVEGTSQEVFDYYGLNAEGIAKKAVEALK